MSGVEIIGAVAAGVQITAQIVRIFRTARNAPRQVERLHRLLEELECNRELLSALSTREGERSARAIYVLINNCRDLIEAKAGAKMAPIDKARNFFWPAENEEYLRKQIDEIRQEIISLGIWLNFGSGKGVPNPAPVADSISGPPRGRHDTLFSDGATIVAPSATASPTVGPTAVASPPTSVAPLSPILSGGTLSGGRAHRRSTTYSTPADLPTVLTLQRSDGRPFGAPMALDRLSIMERDESIRTIEYEAIGGSKTSPLRITHRIPRGTIRIEDNDLNDLCVCFLDAHVITIENSEGYRIHHRIHAEYSFASVEAREGFLLKVRERELLGRFVAKCIRKGNGHQILAQSKVVRLWRKQQEDGHAGAKRRMTDVTVSFLGRDEKQYEVPLADFQRRPDQQGNRITLLSKTDSGSDLDLEFNPAPRSPAPSGERRKSSWRSFGSSASPPRSPTLTAPPQSDADRFKAAFIENHPSTVAWTPLPPISVDEAESLGKDAHIQVFNTPNWGALSSGASSTAAAASSGSSNITSYTIASSHRGGDVDAYSTSPGSRGFAAEFEDALKLRLRLEEEG